MFAVCLSVCVCTCRREGHEKKEVTVFKLDSLINESISPLSSQCCGLSNGNCFVTFLRNKDRCVLKSGADV